MEASSVQVGNADRGASVDWQQGYGFQFWRSTHGFRGDGAYGQFCLVLPDQDTVIVSTGAVEDMQSVLDLVWRILLPAFSDRPLPEAPVAAAALTERLATDWIPLGRGRDRAAASIQPGLGPAAAGAPADTLQLGAVRLAGQGRGRGLSPWTTGSAGISWRWHRSGRGPSIGSASTRASAGLRRVVDRADEFSAQVILVNTPHRFGFRCDLAGGRAELDWHTTPLEDRRLSGRALPAPAG